MNSCKEKHKIRDNDFGVTWCVRCGRLFSVPSGKKLEQKDKIILTTKTITNANR